MKIFIIGEYYPPLRKWLKEGGHPEGVPAVYNFYTYLAKHPRHQFHARIYTQDIRKVWTFENGSTLELVRLRIPIYLFWKFCVYCLWCLAGGKAIRKYQPDVIYAQGSFVSIGARWGKKLGIPSVGRIFGTILTDLVKRKKYFQLYTRNILEVIGIKYPCDLVISTKDGTAYDEVARYFNPKSDVTLMYNGMEQSIRNQLLSYPAVRELSSLQPIYLASISRLFPYKRHHISIDLCKRLRADGLDVRLTIVGSGPELASLKKRAEPIKEYITFIPEMSQYDMLDWLKGQDICTFFYAGGSLGNVLWECALAGKLVVSVDNGKTAEVIRHLENGIIHADNAQVIDETARSIKDLINVEDLQLAENLRKEVKAIIPEWEVRFEKELQLMEDTFLKGQ